MHSDNTLFSHHVTVGEPESKEKKIPAQSIEQKEKRVDEKKSEEKAEQLITYASYINRGYQHVALSDYKGDLYYAITVAVLVSCLEDNNLTKPFSTIFSRLFGEKNKIYLQEVLSYLKADYYGPYVTSTLEMLIVDFFKPMISHFVSSAILSPESKTPLHETWRMYLEKREEKKEEKEKEIKTIPNDIPKDISASHLLAAISEILETKIIVFSTENTTCYGNHYSHDVALVQVKKNHYQYLTNKLNLYKDHIITDYKEKNNSVITPITWSPQPIALHSDIQKLSDDTKVSIFSFLNDAEFLAILKVNKEWNKLGKKAKGLRNLPALREMKEMPKNEKYLSCLQKAVEKNPRIGATIISFAKMCRATIQAREEKAAKEKKVEESKEKENKKEEKISLEKKEPSQSTSILTNHHYDVIKWIITHHVEALSKFCAENPAFDFNCVDDGFVSILCWAHLFPNETILKLLENKGAKLLPEHFPFSPEDYFLMSLDLVKQNKKRLPVFSEIIAETVEKLVEKEFKREDGYVLPMMFAPFQRGGLDENLPFAKTLDNLRKKDEKQFGTLYRNKNDQNTFLEEILRGEVIGYNSVAMVECLLRAGIDEKFFTEIEYVSTGKECLFNMTTLSENMLRAFLSVHSQFFKKYLNEPLHSNGMTILHAACSSPYAGSTVSFLLEQGAQFVQDQEGNNPVHLLFQNASTYRNEVKANAFYSNHQRIQSYFALVTQLFNTNHPSLLERNRAGRTPLMEAAYHHSYEIMALAGEERLKKEVDNNNNTLLHLIFDPYLSDRYIGFKAYLWSILTILLPSISMDEKNKAHVTPFDIFLQVLCAGSGRTTLHEWALFNVIKSLETLLSQIEINSEKFHQILSAILSSTLIDTDVEKLLFSIVKQYHLPVSFPIKFERYDETYQYPLLHFAIGKDFYDLAHYLIKEEKSSAINFTDEKGNTALQYLCTIETRKGVPIKKPSDYYCILNEKPLDEPQIKLVKQLLEHEKIDVNCTQGNYSDLFMEPNSPLKAAILRDDLTLCTLLLAHPNLILRNDPSLLMTMLKAFKHGFRSSPRYQEMVTKVLSRDDLIPLPLCKEPGYVSTMAEMFGELFERIPLDILRRMLLHPNTRKTTHLLDKENDATVRNVWNSRSGRTISSSLSPILLNIWDAQIALHQAETALLKNDFKTTQEKLSVARKQDSGSIDLYIRQVFQDFPHFYEFDIKPLVYLMEMEAVLSTQATSQLILLADRYFKFTHDTVFSEGLCYRAEQFAKTEAEKKSIQSDLHHYQDAKVHFFIDADEEKKQTSTHQNLVSILQSYTGWWGNPFKSQALIFLREIETKKQMDPQDKYQFLIEKYVRLTSEAAPKPVRIALRASITELKEQLFHQEEKSEIKITTFTRNP